MAGTVDQLGLGTRAQVATTSLPHTTQAVVAAGAMIAVLVQTFTTGSAVAAHSCSGGGLSWSVAATGASGSIRTSLLVALAPSGLASGTTITPATASGTHDFTWGMASFLGPLDVVPTSFNNTAASTNTFSASLTSSGLEDLILGGATSDGTLLTGTPSGDNLEGIEFSDAGTSGSIYLVYDLNGEASDTVSGTWSAAQAHVSVGAAFATTSVPLTVMHQYRAMRRMR